MNLKFKLPILLLFVLSAANLVSQNRTLGLQKHTDQVQDGYVLFSNNQKTYLIDNCGEVVNLWSSEYPTNNGIYILENGNLLRGGVTAGEFNAGGRGGVFELFDWDGNLLWKSFLNTKDGHAHHDIAPLPNGNFLAVAWVLIHESVSKENGRMYDGDIWSETIVEIKILPDNKHEIVWQWDLMDHLVQDHDSTKLNYGIVSENPQLLDINYRSDDEPDSGNWMHINAIHYNPDLQQIALSVRKHSEIYIIDHSTTTEEAKGHTGGRYGRGGDILYRYGNPKTYGSEKDQILFKQHDIRWIEVGPYAGDFMVFNNDYKSSRSAVEIFHNPAKDGMYTYDLDSESYGNDSIIRRYTYPPMHSDITSNAEMMPNGNIFFLEGREGIMYEIDEDDNIIWQYINPSNFADSTLAQGDRPVRNILFRAKKYTSDYIAFDDKDLSPIGTVERNPLPSLCAITWTTELAKLDVKNVKITADHIYLKDIRSATLFDLNGQAIPVDTSQDIVNINTLATGFYYLRSIDNNGTLSISQFYKY